MKKCKSCHKLKSLDEYRRLAAAPDGRRYSCAECETAQQKSYYRRNRERLIAEQQKRYYADHENLKAKARARYAANPEASKKAVRERAWMRDFGLTPEAWQALLDSQNGKCAICGATKPRGKGWHVDHCHETGKVRGILCGTCNSGIGHLGDSPARLWQALQYLLRHHPAPEVTS